MNRFLPFLLVLLLVGLGAAYLLQQSAAPNDSSASSGTPSTPTAMPQSLAGADTDSRTEHAAAESALTRADVLGVNPVGEKPALELSSARLEARFVNRLGAPIAGATLIASLQRPRGNPADLEAFYNSSSSAFRASATTDAEGKVALKVIPGVALKLEAHGEFWAPTYFELAALAAGEALNLGDLTLTTGDHLIGRVVDPQGKPQAHASVGLEESGSSIMRGSAILRRTVSDADGYFRIEGLPTGHYRLRARMDGYVAAELNPFIIPGTGRVVEAVLTVHEGTVLEGQVVDLDGRPIVGALVAPQMRFDSLGLEFTTQESEASETTSQLRLPGAVETDLQGNFRLGGLDVGDHFLVVRADGFSFAHVMIPAEGEKLLVRLPPRLSLSGRLLLPDGNPASAVEISIQAKAEAGEVVSYNRLGVTKVETGADGSFTFRNLSAGSYQLSAYLNNAQLEVQSVKVLENITGLNLKMVAAEHLIVHVASASGSALANAKVKVTRGGGESGLNEIVMSFGEDGGSSETIIGASEAIQATTDIQGLAILPGVLGGERRVLVEAEGFADKVFDFVRNEGSQELELVLLPAATLRVVVKTASGRSLSGVEVFLKPQFAEGEELSQTSGMAGRVVWDDLRPGPYALGYRQAQSSMHGMVMFGLEDTKNDEGNHSIGVIELIGRSTLEMEIVVTGMALPLVEVRRNGEPAGGVQVWLESLNSSGMSAISGFGAEEPVVTGADGVALLNPKEPGSYTLVARAGNHAPQVRKEVNIHSGEESLHVELLGAEVTGTLFANSKPVAGASLTLSPFQEPGTEGGNRQVTMSFVMIGGDGGGTAMGIDSGNPSDATAMCDRDGVFRFTDVPAGTWVVKSRAAGFETWQSEPFAVQGGGEVNLGAHQLLEGASISGRNLAADAKPNNGMIDMANLLRLRQENGELLEMAMTNPDGSYAFKDLPAGKYQIVRGSYQSEVLELSAGQQMTFNLPKE